MEVFYANQGMYLLSFFLTLMLLNAYCCGAAVLVKSNISFPCDGLIGDCLIEEDLEMESLIFPYVSRILQDPPQHPSMDALKPDQAVQIACGKNGEPPCHGGVSTYGSEKIYVPKRYSAGCNIYTHQCPH